MWDWNLKQTGVLLLVLPIVVVHYTLSMLLGYPDVESGGVLDGDVLFSRLALFYYLSTLNNELPAPVPYRGVLNSELASFAQTCIKHSDPPRGLGHRIWGVSVHKEHSLPVLARFLPT
jgi:hypothetical protein